MNRRRIISGAALAATLAIPATAGAQAAPEENCLKFDSKDKTALTYTFEGDKLTLTPRTDKGEFLRVKTSKKGKVKVTRAENTYTFDLLKVEGETFEATKRKSGTGKLNLRVNVLDADGDRLTRFDVKVKAYDEVVCESDEPETDETTSGDDAPKPEDGTTSGSGTQSDDPKSDEAKSDDDKKSGDEKSRGRGRGPESEEIRKSRVERGEGRGPETDAERDARKDDDR